MAWLLVMFAVPLISAWITAGHAGQGTAIAQPMGEISYPSPSPSNPDIIAHTRKDGDRHYLYLHHVASGMDARVTRQTRREQKISSQLRTATRSESESLMREAGFPTGYFEGDISWRPVLDQFGYQWFAFVATSTGRSQLYIGYITSNETLETAVFPISFGNVVANPAFSPDGDKLVFSVDGDLYMVQDIGRIIRRRDLAAMQPVPVTDSEEADLFPSWSADGNLIAYQSKAVSGQRKELSSIFLLDVSDIRTERIPEPRMVSYVSEDGKLVHHFRPSWSPSRRILAYYETETNEAEQGGSYEMMKIRLLRIEFDSNRNRYVGMPLFRPAREYFAESVRAFPRSSPSWTVIDYDRQPGEGILWVRDDADLNYPLLFSHLGYYGDNRNDFIINLFGFSNRFAWLDRTMDNRYPVAARSDRHIRFIYVASAEGDEEHEQELKIVDRRSSTSEPVIRREIKSVSAIMRGGLYPGWGHFHVGENQKGWLMATSFTALAGGTAAGAIVRYRRDDAKPGNTILLSLGTATAALWAWNVLDLQRYFPAYREVQVTSTFEGYKRQMRPDYELRSGEQIHGSSKVQALMLSALYPGLGHFYIGRNTRGYVMGGVFSALAGTTLAGAAYRYHYTDGKPSNEVLISLGVATLGTWIYAMLDVQQSFTYAFFADNGSNVPAGESNGRTARTALTLAPKVESMQLGNEQFREYAAIGLNLSF